MTGCVASIPAPDQIGRSQAEPFAGLQSECHPTFPDHDGWYGGDAAYSVPLPIEEGRVSLWLFGDSFVARPGQPPERTYPFVHNTIGISRCEHDGTWSLDTFWKRDDRGAPRAFFSPDPEAGWARRATQTTGSLPYYWLFDGFLTRDALFVGLLRVIHSEPRGAFNLPFRLLGMDLARIENFRDDPANWRVQISTLSNDTQAFPGSAFVVTTSHLHAFTFFDREDGRSPRMLSRLDLDALIEWAPDLSSALEYLSLDSKWKPGLEPENAKIVMDDDASEMSVHFDASTKTWIAVYSDLNRKQNAPSRAAIRIRTAPALAGPWSSDEVIIPIPETDSDHARAADPNLFCYAGKAHPQFSSPTELTLTYVCSLFARNSGETLPILERLRESSDLYRPRAISVSIPSKPRPSPASE